MLVVRWLSYANAMNLIIGDGLEKGFLLGFEKTALQTGAGVDGILQACVECSQLQDLSDTEKGAYFEPELRDGEDLGRRTHGHDRICRSRACYLHAQMLSFPSQDLQIVISR